MKRVIHQSILITLEIHTSGVTTCIAERATAAIASEWLQYIGQRIMTIPSMPAYQISVRELTRDYGPDYNLDYGIQIQILMCWVVLQAHRQEISDFERV